MASRFETERRRVSASSVIQMVVCSGAKEVAVAAHAVCSCVRASPSSSSRDSRYSHVGSSLGGSCTPSAYA